MSGSRSRGRIQRTKRPPIGVDGFDLPGDPGIRGSAIHPFGQGSDLFLRQLLLGRHFIIRIVVADGGDEETLARIARNDGRSTVPSGCPSTSGIETQTAFHFSAFVRVALVTIVPQDGLHLGREEFIGSDREGEEEKNDEPGNHDPPERGENGWEWLPLEFGGSFPRMVYQAWNEEVVRDHSRIPGAGLPGA